MSLRRVIARTANRLTVAVVVTLMLLAFFGQQVLWRTHTTERCFERAPQTFVGSGWRWLPFPGVYCSFKVGPDQSAVTHRYAFFLG